MKDFTHSFLVKLTTILQRAKSGVGQVCQDIPQPTKEEVSKRCLSLCPILLPSSVHLPLDME